MNIKIDTERKTIKVYQSVNLNDLIQYLEKNVVPIDWKEYSIDPITKESIIAYNINKEREEHNARMDEFLPLDLREELAYLYK